MAGTEFYVPAEKLINNLSFSHFTELIKIDDPLKRAYYELIAIKCTLSVRDLKKKITTLSYERTGLSKDKELSLQKLAAQVKPQTPAQAVRDLYVFDFLNLPDYSSIEESELETALLITCRNFSWSWDMLFASRPAKKGSSSATNTFPLTWCFTTTYSNAMC